MLYNPSWKKEAKETTKRNIYSLASLIDWLKTKRPNEAYEYCSSDSCLLAQYFTDMGLNKVNVSGSHVRHKPSFFQAEKVEMLPEHFNNIALHHHTFGDALDSAKNCMAYCA